MKSRFITAYIWWCGCTRKDAVKAYKKATPEFVNLIITAFESNAINTFMCD